MTVLCRSGAAESPAGVSAVGLHQPAPEERHRGDRECDQDQQSLTATGRGQVSFPEPQGKILRSGVLFDIMTFPYNWVSLYLLPCVAAAVPGAISSEPEWLFGLLLYTFHHR